MTAERFHWLMSRLRRFYLYSPWLVDRWLEELAVESDEQQWARAGRLLPSLFVNPEPYHKIVIRLF